MEEHLFVVQINVANIEGVCNFTFTGSNSAIISDSCISVGTQIYILVEIGFQHIFK